MVGDFETERGPAQDVAFFDINMAPKFLHQVPGNIQSYSTTFHPGGEAGLEDPLPLSDMNSRPVILNQDPEKCPVFLLKRRLDPDVDPAIGPGMELRDLLDSVQQNVQNDLLQARCLVAADEHVFRWGKGDIDMRLAADISHEMYCFIDNLIDPQDLTSTLGSNASKHARGGNDFA